MPRRSAAWRAATLPHDCRQRHFGGCPACRVRRPPPSGGDELALRAVTDWIAAATLKSTEVALREDRSIVVRGWNSPEPRDRARGHRRSPSARSEKQRKHLHGGTRLARMLGRLERAGPIKPSNSAPASAARGKLYILFRQLAAGDAPRRSDPFQPAAKRLAVAQPQGVDPRRSIGSGDHSPRQAAGCGSARAAKVAHRRG